MAEHVVMRRKSRTIPGEPATYNPERDLEEVQAEHERIEKLWHAIVVRRQHAAARAHRSGRLSWTRIGELLGGVGSPRAQEIAKPRNRRKATK